MKHILTEAERTSHLIDSLLLLARADSGEDGLHKELTDWSLSVREAVEQVSVAAKEKKIQIELNVPQTPVVVLGDAEALRRAAFILLDNAIKYSVEASAVSVTIGGQQGQAICRVSDAGIGISAVEQEHIFDRFWRADKVRSRGMGGAGLGLSIAKWIADRHQGTIQVSSDLGKGSQFEIRIPLHDAREAQK
jgi:signal transduction histidine kinase